MNSFLPFVAFGFIAWQFISQLVLDGCNVFIANGPIIQQLRAPLSIYIYQTVWRHLIILAHNLLIYVLIAVVYGIWPTWQTLLVIPGILLVSINGMSFGMLLGTLCARFRDIPPIVETVIQMMFLLTPILWRPDQIPGREFLYLFNPFFYLVQIVREPLEGVSPSLFICAVAVGLTAVGFLVSLLFFSRFRNRSSIGCEGRDGIRASPQRHRQFPNLRYAQPFAEAARHVARDRRPRAQRPDRAHQH
jgi:ABC-2 type transport system permease protein